MFIALLTWIARSQHRASVMRFLVATPHLSRRKKQIILMKHAIVQILELIVVFILILPWLVWHKFLDVVLFLENIIKGKNNES